ncbi:MAG: cation:dicarboxylate symporter family transporter, partial [Chitinophagaceae bacterium]
MKKMVSHLSFYVLLAIIAGVVLGIFAPKQAIQLEPLAKGFINIIKLFTYPIIFLTVSLGIASMGSLKKVGRIGFNALIYFEIVSTLSLAIGVFVALIVKPGQINKEGLQMQDSSKYTRSTSFDLWAIIKDNTNLQILILAILVGFVLNFLQKKETYIQWLGKITHYVFVALKWVMYLAPLGALGGMSYAIGKYGLHTLIP